MCTIDDPRSWRYLVVLFQGEHGVHEVASSSQLCAIRNPYQLHGRPRRNQSSPGAQPSSNGRVIQLISRVGSGVKDWMKGRLVAFAVGIKSGIRHWLIQMPVSMCLYLAVEKALTALVMRVERRSEKQSFLLQAEIIALLRIVQFLLGRVTLRVLLIPPLFATKIAGNAIEALFGPTCFVAWMHNVVRIYCCVPNFDDITNKQAATTTSVKYNEYLTQSPAAQVATVMSLLAIFEEITFRCVLNWPLWVKRGLQAAWNRRRRHKGECRPTKRLKSKEAKEGSDSSSIHQPWFIFKGLCFGALHIGNHLGPRSEFASREVKIASITCAVVQSVGCFILSTKRCDPLAEELGLLAAIAAHVSNNLLVVGWITVFSKLTAALEETE